jgi:phenylacetate-CoA ligase
VIAAGANATEMARVIASMRKLRVTVLCVISLGTLMIAETAEVMGLNPHRDFPHLRAICCAGEPMSPSRRRIIESAWGVPVYDNYGMTETGTQAVDCPQRRLHPWLDLFHIEVLDDTLKNDVAPGEVGNVVVTSLTKRAMPMVRYLTGDRARLVDEPCGCGRSATLEVRGRKENTLWIHGKPFDAWELEAIVERLPSRRFWKVAPIADGLRFTVEMDRPSDWIAPELLAGLERDWGIRIEVELVPRGVLYDRTEPISFGLGGKPTYVWSGLPGPGHR